MSGGGMKCSYGAGVLLALSDHYGFFDPDIMIAASGSAGNAVYYLAREMQKTFIVWLSIARDKKMFSLMRKPHFDIHYLVHTIFRKRFPFSERYLKKTKTKLFLPVTSANDGRLIFLKPSRAESLYPYLEAATALPFAYGKSVQVRGKEYIDGDFGSAIEDLLKKAVEEGATKIIMIDNDRAKDAYVRLLIRAYASLPKKMVNRGIQEAARRDLKDKLLFVPPSYVDIIPVIPSKKLETTTLERRPGVIRRTINLGYDDAVNHPKLEELFRA